MNDSPLYTELLSRLVAGLNILPDKPEETPESCLKALWHKAAGRELSPVSALTQPLDPLSPETERALRSLVDARLSGRPLAYLTGRQNFMGLDFISTPQAVIPRKDTEPLVGALLDFIRRGPVPVAQQVVIDVFTGSGNVPLSLARLAPGPRYYGSDLSPEAIELARRNAAHLKLESACTFFCGDLFAPFVGGSFHGGVDVISGAPPFISSSKVPNMPAEISQHEPALAFDAGPFGVALFMRLMAEAPPLLKPGGWLCFEVGLGQGAGILKRLAKDPAYQNVQSFCDAKGDIRAVAAQKR